MPELPEAETIARQLQRQLAGRAFGRVRLTRKDIVHGDPTPLGTLLGGRGIRRVRRRAKRVILELVGGVDLVFRLGMTGRMVVCADGEPVEKHTHLRIGIDASSRGNLNSSGRLQQPPPLPRGDQGGSSNCSKELRFIDPRRFGGVWCLTGGRKSIGKPLGEVGLEPLEMKPAAFRAAMNRRRQIKALLMDQTVIAGLGNIYCDESLHAAGIHPLTRADALDPKRANRLWRAIRATLRKAIRFNGSTLMDYRDADGREGSFQKLHRVYQRHGQPCRTCRTPIRRILAAGRSTFFCPRCQPRRPVSTATAKERAQTITPK